ncbi:MAG: MoxR family ATPase [Rickettsiales bacterium]|jgi:MoxR-like ATPase|nr:MoxR family ATPase [Rickettsiales bacterium]
MKKILPKKSSENIKIIGLKQNLQKYVIGQEELVENLIIAGLTEGHILIEGVPGLAKTLAANCFAQSIKAIFKRIQFTPDLLPTDLIGTEIFNHEKNNFEFKKGPLFSNIILADEINRAPSKVQSALLESMAERQITVADKTHKLDKFFLVAATQNPIEQEGTYHLAEAALDRFMLHVVVTYPSFKQELEILKFETEGKFKKLDLTAVVNIQEMAEMREEVRKIFVSPALQEYIVSLISVTRHPDKYDSDLKNYIDYGVSPRASLSLLKAAQALAYIDGEEFVTPAHIQKMLPNVLRHRLVINYNAKAEGITKDEVIKRIIAVVAY